MKKNLLSLSMLAIALITSSCSNDVDDGQTLAAGSSGQAITFKPWANKQLRSATTAADITDFRLLAWEDAGSVLINGLLVAGSGTSWTYSPLAFWPETGLVNFYAFSPAGSSGVTSALAGQSDPPSIDYELPGHSVNTSTTLAGQEDLLVTNHTNDYAHEGVAGVTLNFRHALSRILVQAKSEGINEFVVLGVALKNIKSSGTLNLGDLPKDAAAFVYPTDNATVASPGYQTLWDTSTGTNGDLVANLPAGGVTVSGSSTYTDVIGDDDALYVIPQENVASDLTKTTDITGSPSSPSSLFYIEITYKEKGQADAEAKTYAVPVPAIVGDARESSIAFEMERQYTFQFELFGRKPIVITNVKASAYNEVEQEEPLRLTWAGSNIYWDDIKKTLTFADSDDKSKEQYQGVFFKWGSLVGIPPSGPLTAYVPDITAIDGSWSDGTPISWGGILYINTDPGASAYGVGSSYLANVTDATNIAALKGDICVYLTKTGAAPKGKRWRMPTADEFKATIQGEYQRIPETGGFGAIGNTNADGTTAFLSGYTKVTSNQPYFPASGHRSSLNGALYNIGFEGYYWSSSPLDASLSYSMHFLGSGGVDSGTAITRVAACPVRCVVE
ncbi:hypothetical protein FACS189416_5420 [Bacteroidia bacterium]|nr:hypothetical protein FACS189416_5420 [Bacteroidia bacterium]